MLRNGSSPEIIIFHPGAELYGADRMLIEAVVAVGPENTVVVLPERGRLADELHRVGATVVFRPMLVLRKALLRPAALVPLLVRAARDLVGMTWWLRRQRPSLVLVSTITLPTALAAARLAGLRVMCHVHESEPCRTLVRAALTAPLFLCHSVVAASDDVASFVASAFPSLARRCATVQNGVPDVSSVRALPYSVPETPMLLFVGRVSLKKGVDIAVEALAILHSHGVQANLTVVGDSFRGYEGFGTELRNRISDLGLSDSVIFAGFVEDPTTWYHDSSIVLVPSRVESFGIVAVEAQLHERPVVASAVGGLPANVAHEVTGLLVEPGSPQALAGAVEWFLSDWDRTRKIAAIGRVDALIRVSVDEYHSKMRVEVATAYDAGVA